MEINVLIIVVPGSGVAVSSSLSSIDRPRPHDMMPVGCCGRCPTLGYGSAFMGSPHSLHGAGFSMDNSRRAQTST
jgi:hypothetical protein